MGRVPTHWEILSLGQVGTLTKGTGGNKEDELPTGMPCVRYGDLYTTHKYFVENARSFIAPEVADQYTKIKFGDVLFAASGETADEIGKSAVNLLRGPAYCGGDVILFRPHGHLIPRYTGYMMDCEPIVHQKATMGRGFTVYHIYGKQLKYLRIPIPPPEEQAAIVRFLDHADEQIQHYIAGKKRLIALLEEERQALVHQAVTRGLDPNVRLKPSGVEWLGEVPEHWQLTPNRALMEFKKDTVGDQHPQYTLLSLTKQGVIPRDLEEPKGKFPSDFTDYQIVQPGDLIFCLFDIEETPRTIGVSEQLGILTGAYKRFVCPNPTTRDFVYFLYLALDDNKLLKPLYSRLRKVITRTTFSSAKIGLPPPEEQRNIVRYIKSGSSEIDSQITSITTTVPLAGRFSRMI